MKVAISMIVTRNKRIDRQELIDELQNREHTVVYIGQESEDEINPDFTKRNVEFLSVPIGRENTNPINEIKTLLAAKKEIQKNSIEVLIAYGIRTFPTVVLAAKMAGVKKILCIVNGSGRLFQLKGIKGFFVKLISFPMLWNAFLLSDKILFQNRDDMKMIKGKGLLWRDNFGTINGSGVNLEKYYSEKLEKKPFFLMISRLTGSKGVNEYVMAARRVKQIYPESTFHLVGPMDDNDTSINLNELQRAIADGIIILEGKVKDVRPYINQCRVFVLPSYYPEGIPRSILEAMAMGRPIITADSSGCRETVIDGKNGFLVPPKDSVALSEKMIWMIEHPNETERMGVESRRLAEEKFDVHKINSLLLKALNI